MRRRFLYWLDASGCSEQKLLQLGLFSHFTEGAALGQWSVTECDNGPSGKPGCIVAGGMRGTQYAPERQQWMPAAGYWLSVEDTGAPPGPQDLARFTQLDGLAVELAGQRWRIPRVWKWNPDRMSHDPALPQAFAPVLEGPQAGRFARQVLPAYRPLVEIAERAWALLLGGATLPWEQAFADAAVLLAANYRVGAAEIGLLGLLDETSCAAVLQACVDLPAIKAQADAALSAGLVPGCPIEDTDAMEDASHG